MIPTWLIEADVFPNEDNRLIAELVRQKVPHVVTKFGKSYEEYLQDFADNACIVFHGSLQFGSLIRRKTNWTGIYCNLPKFECLYYYPRFGEYLLNGEYIMLPFGDLDRRKDWLFNTVGTEGKLFIRPSSGFKTFTGKVASLETWEKDFKLFGFYGVDPEAMVIVAPPAQIKQEWRVVVADNKIIAGSEYKTDEDWAKDTPVDKLPEEIIEYAQSAVDYAQYNPDPVWTIDICKTDQNQLKVVEVGSFSCAGLYACDPAPVVAEVNNISIREWQENNQ